MELCKCMQQTVLVQGNGWQLVHLRNTADEAAGIRSWVDLFGKLDASPLLFYLPLLVFPVHLALDLRSDSWVTVRHTRHYPFETDNID